MTALERLIKLASTDASELYRRTAIVAKLELHSLEAELEAFRNQQTVTTAGSFEPTPPPGITREDVVQEIVVQRPIFTMTVPKESCTSTDSMSK